MRKTLLAMTIAATLGTAAQAQATDLWDIYQLAVNNDPTFLQAQANYEATVENKPIARAGYLPTPRPPRRTPSTPLPRKT